VNRPVLKIERKLLLYCINVIDKNEDSANILFSCGEQREIVRKEERQMNVVGVREFFVGSRYIFVFYELPMCKVSLKNVFLKA
jgi:hypothetical protein